MIKRSAIISFMLITFTTFAYAAGGEHSDAHHGHDSHHAEVSGLPQLDPSTYASQAFWLILVFAFLYLIFSTKSLPAIAGTIEGRAERVQNDLDSAERLQEEVESVQSAYEESLAQAREEASNLFKNIEDDIKKKSEKHAEEFQEKSSSKIDALEKSINKARKKAMDEMSDVAAEIAAEAAEKIIGVRADSDSAKAVVDSLNKAA